MRCNTAQCSHSGVCLRDEPHENRLALHCQAASTLRCVLHTWGSHCFHLTPYALCCAILQQARRGTRCKTFG